MTEERAEAEGSSTYVDGRGIRRRVDTLQIRLPMMAVMQSLTLEGGSCVGFRTPAGEEFETASPHVEDCDLPFELLDGIVRRAARCMKHLVIDLTSFREPYEPPLNCPYGPDFGTPLVVTLEISTPTACVSSRALAGIIRYLSNSYAFLELGVPFRPADATTILSTLVHAYKHDPLVLRAPSGCTFTDRCGMRTSVGRCERHPRGIFGEGGVAAAGRDVRRARDTSGSR